MGWSPGPLEAAARVSSGYTWSDGMALKPILPPSVAGAGVSVKDALRCPPVSRGIGLYAAATMQLEWKAEDTVKSWLNKASNPHGVSPMLRNVRTMTDLLVANRALWITSGRGYDRQEAVHLHAHLWSVDELGTIALGGVLPDANGDYVVGGQVITNRANLIYFPGAMPMPFLEYAQDSLTYYLDILATIKSRAKAPLAVMELKILDSYDGPDPDDEDYDPDEDPIKNTQKAYAAARRLPEGAVTVTPKDVDLIIHQVEDDGTMLIGAREALRVDVANHLNIPAPMLDGESGSSGDYANTLQRRNEFEDLSLALFTAPIAARLSMDDVTPPGQVVDFLPLDTDPSAAVGNTGDAVGNLQRAPAAGELQNA